MLKKIPPDKINVTKNAPFFLSRATTHNSSQFAILVRAEAQGSSF